MNNYTPRNTIILFTALLSIISLFILTLFKTINKDLIDFTVILIFPFLIFIISYFIYSYVIESFLNKRINLIYKIINNHKITKETKEVKTELNQNVLSEIEDEVNIWADKKEKEIKQLNKLEVYRKELLGNASHELKTPIFNIQGYIDTLLDGGLNDPNINMKYLKKASKNIERLGYIVDDLEMISISDIGSMPLELSNFKIHKLIQDIIEHLEMKADMYDIRLKFNVDKHVHYSVIADRQKIAQVLSNLIKNSIRYGKEGGRTSISYFDMGETILIEVSDNGIGIKQKYLPRLFERFFRVDNNRSRELGGSGLGLSIVKHIVENHEQTINVRSTHGVGSTFGFTLKKS